MRIYALDFLRGILILLVIAYHFLFDLNDIFSVPLPFLYSNGMNIFRDTFVSMLIFISGISCNLSHSNIKRGFKTLACAVIISAITYIFMPSESIIFGILHFFGCAMIIYGISQNILIKCNKTAGFIICLLLFFITYNIYYGIIGIGTLSIHFTYVFHNIIFFILGFNTRHFSADYYPLLPWIFMFLSGSFAGRNIKKAKLPAPFYKNICPPLNFIGKHTLIIYMLHQPVMYGLLYLFFRFVNN